jgi:hypothetical protein
MEHARCSELQPAIANVMPEIIEKILTKVPYLMRVSVGAKQSRAGGAQRAAGWRPAS